MRRRLTIAIVGAICLVAIAFALTGPREPVVDGHPISYWLDLGSRGSESEQAAATNAVRKLGTNALPWLVGQIRSKNSKLKEWVVEHLDKQEFLKINVPSGSERHSRAEAAFEIMAADAASAIPDLIPLLDDAESDYTIALTAQRALVSIGPATVEPLLQALESSRSSLWENVAETLGELGTNGAPAVSALIRYLQNSPGMRVASAEALGNIGVEADRVVPALLPFLDDSREDVRRATAYALGDFRTEAQLAVKPLLALIDHPDQYLRSAALFSLGRIGREGEIVVTALLGRMEQTDMSTRCDFLQCLGNFPEEERRILPVLFEAANNGNIQISCAAIAALGKLRRSPNSVVPFLVKRLESATAEVRYTAAEALGEFGKDAKMAVPALTSLLNDEATVPRGCFAISVNTVARTALANIQLETPLNVPQ